MFDTYTVAEAEKLARQLMDEHGLRDWKLEITSSVELTPLGRCNRKTKTIQLAGSFIPISTKGAVRDVILHEIAHALTSGGHDEEWKEVCEKIGALPERFCGWIVLPRSHRQPPCHVGFKGRY